MKTRLIWQTLMQARNVHENSLPNHLLLHSDLVLSVCLHAACIFLKDFQLTPLLKSKSVDKFWTSMTKYKLPTFNMAHFLCDYTFLKWLILSLWEKALCVTFHDKNIHWVHNIIQENMKACRTSKQLKGQQDKINVS